ncbi:MAG: bifunctional hydroxymethylpyrimidine kinase/phosphomethylpyrimidine kinase [Magnetococcales bacterium]|nr:bifunctional hydroxymethylpyrimidine kinase/phosphomethylpyrimidine kinase [Magnetococcales bacterium]
MAKTSLIQQEIGRPAIVLAVAGSDPTAGAGLQADLKTITALGGYGLTAVTAITVQDTRQVYRVVPLPGDLVAQQMQRCLAELPVDAIKLGMLASREIVLAVAALLTAWPHIPVVADPVLAGTGGGTLLDAGGREALLEQLLPRITLLTPNLPEAVALSGLPVTCQAEREEAIRQLAQRSGQAVLLKGGHAEGAMISDLLWDGRQFFSFTHARLAGGPFHGTGCTLAAAIALYLAQGQTLTAAVQKGQQWVREGMQGSLALGKGQRLLFAAGQTPTVGESP